MALFLYGTLLNEDVFAHVAGPGDGTARRVPARLTDHAVDRVQGSVLPMLIARPGAEAIGEVWSGLTARQQARLDLYEVAFGYRLVEVVVRAGGQSLTAHAYFPPADQASSEQPWSLANWTETNAEVAVLAARELDAHDPPLTADEMFRQWPMIAARAHATRRARAENAPSTLRHAPVPDDFGWQYVRPLVGGFFKLAAMEVHHRRFDGTTVAGLHREVLVGVDAALVLPYDKVRDRILVVEQFRTAPARRGDANPWTLEPVAGIVDAGETPEQAARRETAEEAGLHVQALEHMFSFYPSPGSNTDYFHCYLALTDLPDDHPAHGGLADEAEDLRLHLVPRASALDLIATGEITAGPLIAMILWLDRNRERLQIGASDQTGEGALS